MEENEKLKLDEKYMRAAIKQAQKAYAINETPIGCVIVYEGKIIGEVITEGIQIKTRWHMRRLRQSKRQAKKWETGGWSNVQCM